MKLFNQMWCVALLAMFVAPSCAPKRQAEKVEVSIARTAPWPKEAVEAFGRIPVQDRGRVKPLFTYAGFRMLTLNGKRSYTIPESMGLPTGKEKLGQVEWMMDIMLFPEQARHYETFIVNDSAVLEAIGLRFEGRKRRDRYSFHQLRPGLSKLESEYKRIGAKLEAEQELDGVERQLRSLYKAVVEYDLAESSLLTLQTTLGPDPSARLLELYPEGAGGASIPVGTLLSRWPTVVDWMRSADKEEEAAIIKEFGVIQGTVSEAYGNRGYALSWVPPADATVETWRNAGEYIDDAMSQLVTQEASELAILDALGAIWPVRTDMAAVTTALVAAADKVQAAASVRGEAGDIGLELTYHRGKFFDYALVVFLLGFLLSAISWLLPHVKALTYAVWTLASIGLALTVIGVTIRCMLLHRPPVATLYETVLFITAVAVIVCLVAEKMTKERIALASSVALGAGGMFLAGKYELVEAASQGDTMGGLLAVLNTNFWLATHVTTVTMGYSAGLLAAALAHVWLVMRIFRGIQDRGAALDYESQGWYRRFARMVYGVLCFGLLFSVVGTILGGVWANDSWGRFWGWDPKENGALMIVLFELVILHARIAGYIRDFGMCVLAVMGGAVVAFSWWHVNQLGVGLHAYGFTDGVVATLWKYYGFVAVFALVSCLASVTVLRSRPVVKSA